MRTCVHFWHAHAHAHAHTRCAVLCCVVVCCCVLCCAVLCCAVLWRGQVSEQNARNAVELSYSDRNPFVVDCQQLAPLYKGTPLLRCPYCGSAFSVDAKSTLCTTCDLSQVGRTESSS